jgi:7-cyano-7-deazaguanine synthase
MSTADSEHVVTIVSGGMDSVTLAFVLQAAGIRQTFLSFDYGQRHRRELVYVSSMARLLGAPHHTINLTSAGSLLTGSTLTADRVPIPEGYYTDASMRATPCNDCPRDVKRRVQ